MEKNFVDHAPHDWTLLLCTADARKLKISEFFKNSSICLGHVILISRRSDLFRRVSAIHDTHPSTHSKELWSSLGLCNACLRPVPAFDTTVASSKTNIHYRRANQVQDTCIWRVFHIIYTLQEFHVLVCHCCLGWGPKFHNCYRSLWPTDWMHPTTGITEGNDRHTGCRVNTNYNFL